MQNQQQWCFAWIQIPGTSMGGQFKAALVKAYQWKPQEVITVSFLDGGLNVQQRVQNAAQGWLGQGLANLKFSFRNDTNDTLVRITFKYPGSWSVIGTSCRQIPAGQATMNFGWLTPDSADEELNRVVLHEFGHALGLIHEHQNPGSEIHWNKDAVVSDLSGPPNNWTLDVIEHNMFEPWKKEETNFTEVDGESIMMYPIPERWTTDGFSASLNTKLSAKDKSFIHQQYP